MRKKAILPIKLTCILLLVVGTKLSYASPHFSTSPYLEINNPSTGLNPFNAFSSSTLSPFALANPTNNLMIANPMINPMANPMMINPMASTGLMPGEPSAWGMMNPYAIHPLAMGTIPWAGTGLGMNPLSAGGNPWAGSNNMQNNLPLWSLLANQQRSNSSDLITTLLLLELLNQQQQTGSVLGASPSPLSTTPSAPVWGQNMPLPLQPSYTQPLPGVSGASQLGQPFPFTSQPPFSSNPSTLPAQSPQPNVSLPMQTNPFMQQPAIVPPQSTQSHHPFSAHNSNPFAPRNPSHHTSDNLQWPPSALPTEQPNPQQGGLLFPDGSRH